MADDVPKGMEKVQELPCGCEVWCQIVGIEKQFVMRPCSLDCEYLKFSVEQTQRQGKPVRYRRDTKQ